MLTLSMRKGFPNEFEDTHNVHSSFHASVPAWRSPNLNLCMNLQKVTLYFAPEDRSYILLPSMELMRQIMAPWLFWARLGNNRQGLWGITMLADSNPNCVCRGGLLPASYNFEQFPLLFRHLLQFSRIADCLQLCTSPQLVCVFCFFPLLGVK